MSDVVFELNPNFEREFQPQIDAFLRKLAEKVEADARGRVPVDTGRLRDSIHSAVKDGEAVIAASEDYALYVELGTGNDPAQPFLRPALEKVKRL